jgi:hypothetical protein
MSTRTVLLRFVPHPRGEKPSWSREHAVPADLIIAPPQVQYQYVNSVILGYHTEAISRTGRKCFICDQPSTMVATSPALLLDHASPWVNVLMHPVCSTTCHGVVAVQVQLEMAELEEAKANGSLYRCDVCGKQEDTVKCGRCRMAFYCGKAHQRQDWKNGHKPICKEWVARNADLPVC